MALAWTEAEGAGLGAYAEWERETQPRSGVRMVFLRRRAVATQRADVEEILDETHLRDPARRDPNPHLAPLWLPEEEAVWLRRVRELLAEGRPVAGLRAAVGLDEGQRGRLPKGWDVLRVGPPMRTPPVPLPGPEEGWEKPWPLGLEPREAPILGVIDDGLAYLNVRFRARSGTRVAALWRQGEPGGRLLTKREIDERLRTRRDEAGTYAEDGRLRSPGPERRLELQRASHATLAADLAGGTGGGRGRDGLLRRVPILAVDLPTFAVSDTSGRRLESYVARGLRWIVTEALRWQGAGGPRHPLVVNLSLGSLTGSAGASGFLGELIRDEVRRYEEQAGAPMRVVAAYGNERRSRLVAQAEIGPRRPPLRLLWRLPPDDRTSSYLELRATGAAAEDLRIALAAPGEATASLDVPWPAPGRRHATLPQAMLIGDEAAAEGPALVLAVAPTEGPDPSRLSRAGAWRVELRSEVEGVRVVARVQRDDSLPGHWQAGRQSWLDGGGTRGWSEETRDWTGPGEDDPVTPAGSGAAYPGAPGGGLLLVGAARRGPGRTARPAPYSGEGSAAVGSEGPDLVAVCEDGEFLPGRRGAGRLSGATVRGRGTSIAAPLVTRALLMAFWRHGAGITAAQEAEALYGPQGPACNADPRLGRGTLPEGRG